jgi:hypothetical protein
MVALVVAVCLLEAAGLGAVLSIDLTAERVEAHTADLAAQASSKAGWTECMPLQQVSVDVRHCGHE